MSHSVTVSLSTLPVEIIYRILDYIDILTIEISLRNVCTRLKAITDAYRQYQVNFHFIINSVFNLDSLYTQCLIVCQLLFFKLVRLFEAFLY